MSETVSSVLICLELLCPKQRLTTSSHIRLALYQLAPIRMVCFILVDKLHKHWNLLLAIEIHWNFSPFFGRSNKVSLFRTNSQWQTTLSGIDYLYSFINLSHEQMCIYSAMWWSIMELSGSYIYHFMFPTSANDSVLLRSFKHNVLGQVPPSTFIFTSECSINSFKWRRNYKCKVLQSTIT